jgi:hypothetical protein
LTYGFGVFAYNLGKS